MMKMKKSMVLSMVLLFMGVMAGGVATADSVLFEWAFNVDGTVSYMPAAPGGFNAGTGLGTWEVTISGAGAHNFIAYFDHEIDETTNSYSNEFGTTYGTLAAGQSWEIDEPGWVFGNIYANMLANTLDNSNGVPSTAPDDVSMALGWNFLLSAGETAKITLLLSATMPTGGFYLAQTDPDSPYTFYYSGDIDIRSQGVPEPGTLLLLGSGLAGLVGLKRRMKR
jgi:hypothetical protein